MTGELPKNFAQVAVDAAVIAETKAETVARRKASQDRKSTGLHSRH